MSYFIYTSHHFTPHGRYELNKLASLPMCGFIAQLVEHRTGIAEVTGSNPVEALIFFSGFFFPKMKQQTHDKLNVWRTRKKSESQMGFEPMTLRDLVGVVVSSLYTHFGGWLAAS